MHAVDVHAHARMLAMQSLAASTLTLPHARCVGPGGWSHPWIECVSPAHAVHMCRVSPVCAQNKADANLVDHGNGQQTPLHLACVNGRHECVRLLIEANADPSATTSVRARPRLC